MVSFIDDYQAWICFNALKSSRQRLHRGNLHRLGIHWMTCGNDAVVHPERFQRLAGLLQKLTAMHQDQHLLAFGRG